MMVISVTNLDDAIEHYTNSRGYRLEMVVPADAPRAARLSKGGESVQLVANEKRIAENGKWITGRAGMEYCDLIPGRMGGKVIASHIRLTKAGDAADYVHYHKIDFQMIYCKRGRIKVVYQDQGEPLWLETGDCVLQPPEIRHRVLECTTGAEVIEIGMPAEHETWVEHDITLPTLTINAARDFGGQRFVRHIRAESSNFEVQSSQLRDDSNFEHGTLNSEIRRDLGIAAATGGRYAAHVQRLQPNVDLPTNYTNETEIGLFFKLNNNEMLSLLLNNKSDQP
ncbi:MAG: hypothetical protein ABIP78_00820 [Pyrinomonadaceae bacterium]